MITEQSKSTFEFNAFLIDQRQIFRLRHDRIYRIGPLPLLIFIGLIAFCIDVVNYHPVSIPAPPFRI